MSNSEPCNFRLYLALFLVCFSTGILASSNWVSINLIEPYVLCWLYNTNPTFLGQHLQDNYVSASQHNCSQAYNLLKTGHYEPIINIWASIRSIFGWAAGLGSLIGYPLIDKYGRSRVLFLNALINLFGCSIMLFIRTKLSIIFNPINLMILSRLLLGINTGIGTSAGILYVTEIAPLKKRGLFGITFTLFSDVGLILGNGLGSQFIFGNQHDWQKCYIIPLILGSSILFLSYFVPETPAFYENLGQNSKANSSRKRLGYNTNALQNRFESKTFLKQQEAELELHSNYTSIWNKGILRCIIFTCLIFIFGFCNGVAVLTSSYSNNLLASLNVDYKITQIVAILLSSVRTVFLLISNQTISKTGMKKPLYLGHLWVAIAMFLFMLASFFNTDNQNFYVLLFSIILLISMVAAFDLGICGITWNFPAEMTPIKYRGLTQSLGGIVWAFSIGLIELMFPFLNKNLGNFTFLIFSSVALVGSVFVYFYVPETKNKTSLELVQELENFSWGRKKPVSKFNNESDSSNVLDSRSGEIIIDVQRSAHSSTNDSIVIYS